MTELKRRILEDIILKVGQAKYNDVAPLLMRIKVVTEAPKDGRQRSEQELETEKRGGKRLIWQTNGINLLADSLYRDYLKVENDWLCAAELCQLTVSCCIASADLTHDPEFRREIVEKVSKGLWHLMKSIHQRVDWGLDQAAISRSAAAFHTVSISCNRFYMEFPDRIDEAWQSSELMTMLEDKINRSQDHLLVDLCLKLTKLNQSSVFNLTSDRRHRFLDAVVEKLHHSNDAKLANACTQFLTAWLEAYPLTLSSLMTRHGITVRTQLERWLGHGFDMNVNLILSYMNSGIVADGNKQRIHEAAARIQAAYRAYIVRRRVAKMKAGFRKLQQLFRIRKQTAAKTAASDAAEFETEYQKNVTKYKKDRNFLEKRFQTVSCIHASLVDRYLETEADRAATIIQAAWRGYLVRKNYKQRLMDARRDRAARIIQKNMRGWCEKRRQIRNRLRDWPGLTESRREELQAIIDRYQERYKIRRLAPKQAQKELHEKAQSMLIDNYKRRYTSMNAFQKRHATLARLKMNLQMLETAPKLAEVTGRDMIAFRAGSEAIASRALHAHKEELRFHRLPKWKQLLEKASDNLKE